jgi:hypothetical protein
MKNFNEDGMSIIYDKEQREDKIGVRFFPGGDKTYITVDRAVLLSRLLRDAINQYHADCFDEAVK